MKFERFIHEWFAPEASDFVLLGGGHWSLAYRFRSAGRQYVARFGKHIEDFEKDQAASTLSTADIPVPRVLKIGPALDGYCCVSEYVAGVMIDDQPMRPLVPAVMRLLEALRLADSCWLPERSWADELLQVDEETERVFGWHDAMAASPYGLELYEKVLSFLRERVGDLPDLQHVIHNDLLHNNVIVQGDQIAGVIDWGNAMRGDHLYDLAMFTFYQPWYPGMAGIDWGAEASALWDVDPVRMQCCEAHLALSGLAYNAFKHNWKDFEAVAVRVQERLPL